VYDSDDERAYAREKVPDPRSEEYFNDEVDEFHANRDKVSCNGVSINSSGGSAPNRPCYLANE
jgi:hypothetical protein